jgi:hypothetical protein
MQDNFDNLLESLNKLVADPINREARQAVSAALQALGSNTEDLWASISSSKDTLSYVFNTRLFPTFGEEENKIVHKAKRVDPPGTDIFRTREERIKEYKQRYDVRTTIRDTLNATYIDEACANGMYRVVDNSQYYLQVSQDVINRIFTVALELREYGFMLELFCILVSTREYYHLAFHETILELMFNDAHYEMNNPFRDPGYIEIIYHFLFYGMYLLYKEECIVRACVLPRHRHVLPLNAVRWLPNYFGGPESNPYLPVSLGENYLLGKHVAPEHYFVKPIQTSAEYRGLYSDEDFQERFRVFSGGIFTELPTDRLWFSGSLIPACAIRNPLERLFGIEPCPIRVSPRSEDDPEYSLYHDQREAIAAHWREQTEALTRYFDEYYPSKGILIPEAMDDPEVETKLSDIDILVDVIENEDFDHYTNIIFHTVRKNLGEAADLQLIRIDTRCSYKYYLSGKSLIRTLEIFRPYGSHPIGGVSRFHFPAVRGVYDGQRVFVLPSLVAYAYTGIFLDYKWMSSVNDTKDLVLKYYSRGGVPLLNAEEHRLISEHVSGASKGWQQLQKYFTTNNHVSLMHPIFRPRQYGHSIYTALQGQIRKCEHSYEWVEDGPESSLGKKSRFGFELELRFPSGHIRPLELWKIRAYVSALHRSERYPSLALSLATK